MTHEELEQTLVELIEAGWIGIDEDERFHVTRCLLCEGTGLLVAGYCACKMGRDLQRVSQRIRV